MKVNNNYLFFVGEVNWTACLVFCPFTQHLAALWVALAGSSATQKFSAVQTTKKCFR